MTDVCYDMADDVLIAKRYLCSVAYKTVVCTIQRRAGLHLLPLQTPVAYIPKQKCAPFKHMILDTFQHANDGKGTRTLPYSWDCH